MEKTVLSHLNELTHLDYDVLDKSFNLSKRLRVFQVNNLR